MTALRSAGNWIGRPHTGHTETENSREQPLRGLCLVGGKTARSIFYALEEAANEETEEIQAHGLQGKGLIL